MASVHALRQVRLSSLRAADEHDRLRLHVEARLRSSARVMGSWLQAASTEGDDVTQIVLTPEQECRAALIGFKRQENAVRHEFRARHRVYSLWAGHIEGACAELAASLATRLPWTGEPVGIGAAMPRERQPDLGRDVEVRWSMSKPPRLHFDPAHDRTDWTYVLVSGYSPTFVVHGSMHGSRCCDPRWRHEYPERAVFRVPLSALTPIAAHTPAQEVMA